MAQYDKARDTNGGREQQDVCKTVIERSRDKPDQCTIYDTDVTGGMSTTRWISAVEGSYVFSELMR